MKDTHIGMTYDEWRASQEAKGFRGGMSSAFATRVKQWTLEGVATEGMLGHSDVMSNQSSFGEPDRGIIPLDDIFGTSAHWENDDETR